MRISPPQRYCSSKNKSKVNKTLLKNQIKFILSLLNTFNNCSIVFLYNGYSNI